MVNRINEYREISSPIVEPTPSDRIEPSCVVARTPGAAPPTSIELIRPRALRANSNGVCVAITSHAERLIQIVFVRDDVETKGRQ